jgi:two-component system, cell cycle sensor histidine kinase and response regulator CckA
MTSPRLSLLERAVPAASPGEQPFVTLAIVQTTDRRRPAWSFLSAVDAGRHGRHGPRSCTLPGVDALLAKLAGLEAENARLRAGAFEPSCERIVHVPPDVQPLFDKVAATMRDFFRRIEIDPARARIAVDDERYVLVRASAFSIDFLDALVQLYADRGERDALAIARGFLFDIAHTIGIHDARTMHEKLGSREPMEKLSGGPIHFAYTGWASVLIDAASHPVPDASFCLVYEHPFSFEAASFLRAGRVSEGPVCIMNAGYSSGWCGASFGLELTAIEVKCRARGDDGCFFVMAPPDRVAERVREHHGIDLEVLRARGFDVPTYFERKRAEEEVRRSLARLEEAQEELIRKERLATVGLLVSGVAHEVNTPLGVAVTASGVLQQELGSLQERFAAGTLTRSDLKAFFEHAGRAASLVDRNLEKAAGHIARFKRVAVDHGSQERRRVDVGAYVEETIDSLGPVVRKAGIAVSVERHGDLTCLTHPGAIAQIVTNFVTNTAMHAAPSEGAGGVRVSIVAARTAPGVLVLRYRDDGCGMTDEVRQLAFQPFFTTRRGGGGSGLGLHIVHSLVTDVLGGRIVVESAPGAGAAFEITFPVA